MLQRAETTAVFQLESRGMKELIKKLKPDCLEDLIALLLCFDPFLCNQGWWMTLLTVSMGAELAYPHPDYQYAPLELVLKPTYWDYFVPRAK